MTSMPPPHADRSDTGLMERVRDDDTRAFETLYGRHHRKVLNFFYGMSRDTQVASDLCQETFLRIWKLRKRYNASGSFLAYLFTFARNVWLEKCRDYTRNQKFADWTRRNAEEKWGMGAPTPAPDEAAARSELGDTIGDALQSLPEEQRMVVVLRMIKGLSLDEVAAALHCPVNTVRSRKILAMKKLRTVLNQELIP